MSDESKTKAKAVRVLSDVRVIADLQSYRPHNWDLEQYAKSLERDAKEFVEHCRDHRSLDGIRLEVERVYTEQCSACNRELETVHDPEMNDGRKSCAWCGTEIE